jgi:lipopolysaccharide biosynthesis regulator YciM
MADIDTVRELVAKVPDYGERRGEPLGWLGQRRISKAVGTLETVLRDDPESRDARWTLGEAHFVAGELDVAWELLAPLAEA